MADRKAIAGYALLAAFVILAAAAAFLALSITGEKGIEERFLNAVGLQKEEGHPVAAGAEDVHDQDSDKAHHQEARETPHGEEGGGFSLEGDMLLYLSLIGLLGIVCILAYRRFSL